MESVRHLDATLSGVAVPDVSRRKLERNANLVLSFICTEGMQHEMLELFGELDRNKDDWADQQDFPPPRGTADSVADWVAAVVHGTLPRVRHDIPRQVQQLCR